MIDSSNHRRGGPLILVKLAFMLDRTCRWPSLGLAPPSPSNRIVPWSFSIENTWLLEYPRERRESRTLAHNAVNFCDSIENEGSRRWN